jgi:hypothetical protein
LAEFLGIKTMKRLDTIGRDAFVDITKEIKNIPAKIDTGADGSAIWASDVHLDKSGRLVFKLFGKGSPYYTGKTIRRTKFSVASVKSASGDITIKFKVPFKIKIGSKTIKTNFGLCDRSTHNYPILIGRRTLANNFIVDVSQNALYVKPPVQKSLTLNQELRQNPDEFYQKYFLNEEI